MPVSTRFWPCIDFLLCSHSFIHETQVPAIVFMLALTVRLGKALRVLEIPFGDFVLKPGAVVLTHNHDTRELEAEESGVRKHTWPHEMSQTKKKKTMQGLRTLFSG